MDKKPFSVCFTGYRPEKMPYGESSPAFFALSLKVYETLLLLAHEGADCFYCGMAMGCDLMFGENVLKLKNAFPNIKLILAIPFKGQGADFSPADKKRYANLLYAADESVLLHDRYLLGCMAVRNRYMVDRSDTVVAVFDGKKGGTMSTLAYAKKQGKEIKLINPNDFYQTI